MGDWPKFEFRAQTAALLAVLLLGAALRFPGLNAQSVWHDEALTAISASAPMAELIHTVRHRENSPPGYFIVVNLWAKVFGISDLSLRLPSAIAGVVAILVIYRLGKELFDARIALTAAALLAVSPFHIVYSQEARHYALLLLMVALCTWAFVRVLRSGSARAQVAYVLTAAAALYVHTFAIFAITAVNLFYLWRLLARRQAGVTLRQWIVLQAAIVVLFGPWVPATREVAQMGLPWMRRPASVQEAMLAYAGGVWPLVLLALLTGVGFYRGWRERKDGVVLLAAMVIMSVVAPVVYGIFWPRYGIAALIGLTLLPAYAAAWFGRITCVAVVLLAGLANLTPQMEKPDIRMVARHLIEHGRSEDLLLNRADPLFDLVLEYYLAGRGPRRVEAVHDQPQARIWVLDRASNAVESRVSRLFDGLVLMEVPPGEPVAAERRSD